MIFVSLVGILKKARNIENEKKSMSDELIISDFIEEHNQICAAKLTCDYGTLGE